ncbi:MAG: GGDEF domain-containing protein [Synergistales bacterium]|nr:GGDEF domain-containing protein [Synergistales bacterium]
MFSITSPESGPKKYLRYFIFLAPLLFLVTRQNYLLGHVLIEGWAILVGFTIYVMATKTYGYSKDNFLFFLGYGYLAVSFIDLVHTLAYKGMGIFPFPTADLSTQLWIAARYLEAFVLFSSSFMARKKFSSTELFLTFGILVSLIILSIMKFGIFPRCFIEGQGLTPFKVMSEYIIIAILAAALTRFRKQDEAISSKVQQTLKWSIMLTMLSELSFTFYTDVYGLSNLLGHLLKAASFCVVFEGIIARGLDQPFETIFRKLRAMSMTDPLTLLYNRVGFNEFSEKIFSLARRERKTMGMIMIDLDNFKKINDNFGHLHGDEVLLRVGDMIRKNIRSSDIASRIGGDEFCVILPNAGQEGLVNVADRIREDFHSWVNKADYREILDISIGFAIEDFTRPNPSSMDDLLLKADRAMYCEKSTHKRLQARKDPVESMENLIVQGC